MTLEDKIKALLAEQVTEAKSCGEGKKDMEKETPGEDEEVVVNPKKKEAAKDVKEETEAVADSEEVVAEDTKVVSEQVAALLETEGLSEEFKTEALAIFEAAVNDKVAQAKQQMQEQFDAEVAAAKTAMAEEIDGYLSAAVAEWISENEVAIETTFKSQLAESFVDGLQKLFVEHNIELPADKVDLYETVLEEKFTLEEKAAESEKQIAALQEQVNGMKKASILESFKTQMTVTEFDRFTTLVESIAFESEDQYKTQLNIVKENFGTKKPEVKQQISESAVVTNKDPLISKFAEYINNSK